MSYTDIEQMLLCRCLLVSTNIGIVKKNAKPQYHNETKNAETYSGKL